MSEEKKAIYETTIYLKSGQTITLLFYDFSIDFKGTKKTVSWEGVKGEEQLMTLDPDDIAAVTYKIKE